jgi:hypothetical protein
MTVLHLAARWCGRWAALAVALAALLVARAAVAQTAPKVTVRASSDTVEVGEPFNIELKVMVDRGDPQPTSPQLHAPRAFTVDGPSTSTQTVINGMGARAQISVGIGATWQLVAQKAGKYTIPSPTVLVDGKLVGGSAVTVEVVPASGRPRVQPNNPFLFPGGPGFSFPFPFQRGAPQDDDDTSDPRASPELAMTTAPDPVVFVRAVTDKKTAVVGEQVTLSFYVYFRYETQIAAWHEAPLSDFMRVGLLKNPGTEQAVIAVAGNHRYHAKLFDRQAIFPVKAGDLHTGSLRVTFGGARVGAYGDRETEDIVIHATEPPRAGRPRGYEIGDVGRMGLTASVQPRHVDQGGTVAVSLKLTGTGNLPHALHMPERTGIEWLDPEQKDSIEPQNGVIGGWRSFGYVVHIKESGAVDLGEVVLPYWDPVAKSYQVTKAQLGTVQVTPTSPPIDPATNLPTGVDPPKADPFAAMPSARASLGPYTPPRTLFEGRSLWLLIAAPPLMVGLVSAGSGAARRARKRRATLRDTPGALAQKALDEAALAETRGDGKAVAAAVERAVHLAVEGATGLKSRGVLLADLPGALAKAGVAAKLVEETAGAFSACEAVRFDPAPESTGTRELLARARAVVADLGRHKAT